MKTTGLLPLAAMAVLLAAGTEPAWAVRDTTRPAPKKVRKVIKAQSDPGNLFGYRNRVGKSFYFQVTGPYAGTKERFRRPDRDGEGLSARRARGTGSSPLAPLLAAKMAGRGRKGAASRLPANAPKWFREYDTDGDGQVSLAEWIARGHSVKDFQKADLNGDGFITLKELMRAGLFVPSTALLKGTSVTSPN
jgi:hypothetical protein